MLCDPLTPAASGAHPAAISCGSIKLALLNRRNATFYGARVKIGHPAYELDSPISVSGGQRPGNQA